MKAKSTKMLALAVIIGLCAVAIIGAAYAAFSGTAKTYNQGNTAEAGYIEIGNSTWTAMASGVEADFDTYSAASGTVYYLNANNAGVGTVDEKTALQLATKTVTLTNESGAAVSSVTVAVKASTAFENEDFIYFMGVTIGQNTVYLTLPATASTDVSATLDIDLEATAGVQTLANHGTTNVTYTLYIGYVADMYIPNSYIGDIGTYVEETRTIAAKMADAGPSDMASTDFGFTITAPAA